MMTLKKLWLKVLFLEVVYGAASLYSFYVLLQRFSSIHPMGVWRLMVLAFLGALGMFLAVDAILTLYEIRKIKLFRRQLFFRLQGKDDLFERSYQMP